jgi:glycosyltransferase involved in cell wall biosynthesis
MRIGLIASPHLPVPPPGYGGTERVIDNLAVGLAERGHAVTVFARSGPAARSPSRPVAQSPLRVDLSLPISRTRDWAYDFVHAAKVLDLLDEAEPFDVVHNHSPAMIPLLGRVRAPQLTTVHGDTRRAPAEHIYRCYPSGPYVALSSSQQVRGLTGLNWIDRVPPGVDQSLYRPAVDAGRGGYLLHLGSLGRRKGTLDAIHLAKAVRRPLVVIGSWDPRDREYCEQQLLPHLDDPNVTFLGERGDQEKAQWLRGAAALVHPLAWDEPFGLAIVEALASGIPVLALDRGAARELIDHGRTGFLGTHWTDLIEPARGTEQFVPEECRSSVAGFTVDAMVEAYLEVYERVVK